jgi:hypothetical protein
VSKGESKVRAIVDGPASKAPVSAPRLQLLPATAILVPVTSGVDTRKLADCFLTTVDFPTKPSSHTSKDCIGLLPIVNVERWN